MKFTTRSIMFTYLPIAVLLFLIATDPTQGKDQFVVFAIWANIFFATAATYWISKSLTGEASSQELYNKARDEGNVAAAVAYASLIVLRSSIFFTSLYFLANSIK